jgi:hypothetical protein
LGWEELLGGSFFERQQFLNRQLNGEKLLMEAVPGFDKLKVANYMIRGQNLLLNQLQIGKKMLTLNPPAIGMSHKTAELQYGGGYCTQIEPRTIWSGEGGGQIVRIFLKKYPCLGIITDIADENFVGFRQYIQDEMNMILELKMLIEADLKIK